MLTTVILEGPMGMQFGRMWKLAVETPSEALQLINANKPGLFNWIRANLQKYARYRVQCEYEDGRVEEFDTETYRAARAGGAVTIRFAPLVDGASGVVKFVVGAILVIAGSPMFLNQPWMMKVGAMLMLSGAVQMLTGKRDKNKEEKDKSSTYFDGPVNTNEQGAPVPLIYGRCLVGSQLISSRLTIDQLQP